MRRSIIVAMGRNGVIGKDNRLPWHLPADLRFFKRTTMGHPMIMGRRTYDSVGMPLPGRTNIVVTRSAEFAPAGVVVARTPDEALQLAEARDAEEIFIAGGSEIFRLMLPMADRMYVTRIEADFDGDTFFPDVDWRQWELVSSEEHQPDEKNRWAYSFLVYDRKK